MARANSAPGLFGKLFKAKAPPADVANILALDLWPVAAYAVGDIHGCLGLYRELEARLDADAASLGGVGLVVVLGDTIDRGPESARVIDHLLGAPPQNLMRVVLRGNHEEMFEGFLNAPNPASDWLHHGGIETLASYGVDLAALRSGKLSARKIGQMLDSLVPPEHRRFLQNLPDALILPPFMFVHAGVDVALSPEHQTARVLRWGPGPEHCALDYDGFPLKVAHGHTPTADGKVEIRGRRINLDTGAYASGKLSAVRLTPDGAVQVMEQIGSTSASGIEHRI